MYTEFEEENPVNLPHVQNTWTIGTVLAATGSIVSLISLVSGGIWFAAKLSDSTKAIPQNTDTIRQNAMSIAVLQDQQHYTDIRYAEIMTQLEIINQKLDKQPENNPRTR